MNKVLVFSFLCICLAAGSAAIGVSFGFAIGERVVLASVNADVAAAASITSGSLEETFNLWGNLLPLQIEGDNRCVAFNVMDQTHTATWSKDKEGRCRIRDFLIQKFVGAVSDEKKARYELPPQKSGD